ncbi:MFS transporter [Lindgomyces ingoldianus]|uniref:MFS transporter n=1 Tax=Lindgomyces ingoldianus TaxID=673940 RepID=A0ACB6QAZ1_9PLEO|nr:MFS transporter [Lindgomyces ingoldianus]KAF2464086.1 MFS transporter [Lindgomyces ingoldianus]
MWRRRYRPWRNVVANARIEGLTTDLHMTGNQYLTGLTLYFIGYVLFELPTLTLAWGIVATLMGVTQNLSGFSAVRFFLGVTESGLFPGVVFYLSMWYKRAERQYRISLFFSAASLAGAFGGILAWGIAHMRNVGGYKGWRWIFILGLRCPRGLLTIVISLIAYFFISNYPSTVSWLSDDERDSTHDEKFSWAEVWVACKDVKCWLYGFAFHTMSLPLYTLSLFLPTIIQDMGYTSAQSQLLTIPPYALATIFTVIWTVTSEKSGRRAPFIIRPGVSYLGTFFAAAGIYPSVALVLSWPANNVSGQTKRATANAMQISIGNCGAVLGTQLYRPITSPRYVLGHSFALGYLVMNIVVVSRLWYILSWENKKKQEHLEKYPETKGFHDSDEDLILGDQHPRWHFNT